MADNQQTEFPPDAKVRFQWRDRSGKVSWMARFINDVRDISDDELNQRAEKAAESFANSKGGTLVEKSVVVERTWT